MKSLAIASALALLLSASAACAQGQTSTPSTTSQPSQSSPSSDQNRAAANKIKQDLTNAGFTDVKVVAESFVVQAKSKDGDPVLMTIGPHGMSVFEAMNTNGTGSNSSKPSGTTGSTANTSK